MGIYNTMLNPMFPPGFDPPLFKPSTKRLLCIIP